MQSISKHPVPHLHFVNGSSSGLSSASRIARVCFVAEFDEVAALAINECTGLCCSMTISNDSASEGATLGEVKVGDVAALSVVPSVGVRFSGLSECEDTVGSGVHTRSIVLCGRESVSIKSTAVALLDGPVSRLFVAFISLFGSVLFADLVSDSSVRL